MQKSCTDARGTTDTHMLVNHYSTAGMHHASHLYWIRCGLVHYQNFFQHARGDFCCMQVVEISPEQQ